MSDYVNELVVDEYKVLISPSVSLEVIWLSYVIYTVIQNDFNGMKCFKYFQTKKISVTFLFHSDSVCAIPCVDFPSPVALSVV